MLFSGSSLVYDKPAFLRSPKNFLEQEERNRSKGSFNNYVDKKRGSGGKGFNTKSMLVHPGGVPAISKSISYDIENEITLH